MAPQITCYLDCVSPYSYFAFTHLNNLSQALQAKDIEVDFVPVFLGGINVASGNTPPWQLPAKAKYLEFDIVQAKAYYSLPDLKRPEFFPIVSLVPQRAALFIKSQFPTQYLASYKLLYAALWERSLDISQTSALAEALSPLFAPEQIAAILEGAASPEIKQGLLEKTQDAVKAGAFGAPWFVVRNARGEESPFFGSDRFHFMWQFLGLEWDFAGPGGREGQMKL
ncbi:hypothetical protein RUND412_001117 [Rhizina undulata]